MIRSNPRTAPGLAHLSACWAAAAGLALLTLMGCTESSDPAHEKERGVGRLFLPGGAPAAFATVRIYKVGEVPAPAALLKSGKSAGSGLVLLTDAQGRFETDALENGEYNILAELDGAYAYRDSMPLGANSGPLEPDTLDAPGTVRGRVALEPQHNPATVLVQILGTHRFTNVDASGRFEFDNLAGGTYSIRVFTTEPEYTPVYSSFRAVAGREIDHRDTLRPIFTGIPAVRGLRARYDTLTGVVHLSWNRVPHSLLQDYVLYRDAGMDAPAMSPSFAFTRDTAFADTLWTRHTGGPSGTIAFRLDYDDSGAYAFTWRVRPRLKTQAYGPFLEEADLETLSPKWVHTQASLRLAGPYEDAATIRDTVPLVLSFLNPLHRIKTIRWYDDLKDPPIREIHPDRTLGKDTLIFRAGAGPSRPAFFVDLIDEKGVAIRTSFQIRVYDDIPEVRVTDIDTQPAIGDTIRLRGSASDLGRIVRWEWSVGTGPFLPAGRPETTLVIDHYSSGQNPYARLRAIDEDGRIGLAESYVEVYPFRTLKKMPHPRADFTATVVDGKIYLIGGGAAAVDVYDPATGTWATKAAMGRPRHAHQAELFGEEIMIVGGRSGNTLVNVCEFYNIRTDVWRDGPALRVPRTYFGLSKQGSQLFAFEGAWPNSSIYLNSVERYDSATNQWSLMPWPIQTPRAQFSTATIGPKTYSFGGSFRFTFRHFYFLTQAEDIGNLSDQSPVLRATAVHGPHILFAGGQVMLRGNPFVTYWNRFDAYDTRSNSFTQLAVIKEGRQSAALAVVDGRAYLFGGNTLGPSDPTKDVAESFIPALDSVLSTP